MQYRVTTEYARHYADPIAFERGEAIQRERPDDQFPGWWWCTDKRGKSGWVHERYFEEDDYRFLALEDYRAWELNARVGEVLDGSTECGGWAMCTNLAGEMGWVPLDHLQPL